MKTRPALSRTLLAAVLLFAAATLGADCAGNIVQDPTFRDWCGSSLCSWQTDFGQVARVPTWDANDFGVSFLDDGAKGTQISQVTQENEATCVLFTSVANIDPAAEMYIGADFDNDGTVDYWAPLGTATWQRVQTEITAPPAYDGITFYLDKRGTGTAVLAEMSITSTTGCTAAPPTVLGRLGEPCATTSDCAAGLVCPQVGFLLCSQCSDEVPCADGGGACQARPSDPAAVSLFPLQCGPGQGLGVTGAPCIANDDCASGVCAGAIPVGLLAGDAGPCDLNAVSPDASTNCSWDTVYGGTCE